MSELSPALTMAVQLIANGDRIAAYLCDRMPHSVADIENCSIGSGNIGGDGGMLFVRKDAEAVCIAYDVGGQLVVSTPQNLPCRVAKGAQCKVGPLTLDPGATRQ